jgi:DNA mismatch endonuclease Vsr
MPDIYSKEKRSQIMSAVRHKDTLPELIVQSLIRNKQIEYEREIKILNCTPDIVIKDLRKIIFVNGCFWHGHECKNGELPKSNLEYWKQKIEKNKKRDIKNYSELSNEGWQYLVIWECELKKKNLDTIINRISEFINS